MRTADQKVVRDHYASHLAEQAGVADKPPKMYVPKVLISFQGIMASPKKPVMRPPVRNEMEARSEVRETI